MLLSAQPLRLSGMSDMGPGYIPFLNVPDVECIKHVLIIPSFIGQSFSASSSTKRPRGDFSHLETHL